MRKVSWVCLGIVLTILFAFVLEGYAGGHTYQVAKGNVSIAANGTNAAVIQTIPLWRLQGVQGFFSLHVIVTGDGTVKGEYKLSNDKACSSNFVEPASASDIFTGMTSSGGPGSDGVAFYSFSPEPANCMQILFTETGTSDTVNIDGRLVVY